MKTAMIGAAAVLAAALAPASAQAAPAKFSYEMLDQNRDGLVTSAEAQVAPAGCRLVSVSRGGDLNRDGVVTTDEAHTGVTTMKCRGLVVRVPWAF